MNPLAADDHMKEVIQQLQLMGEVIYVKGSVCVDVIGKNQRIYSFAKGKLFYRAVFSFSNPGVFVVIAKL